MYALFCGLMPETFLRGIVLETIGTQTVVVAIVAVGMTLVIIGGGIDLSVGSAVALVTVVVALALKRGHGPAVASMIGISAGLGCGLLNGALVAKLKIT